MAHVKGIPYRVTHTRTGVTTVSFHITPIRRRPRVIAGVVDLSDPPNTVNLQITHLDDLAVYQAAVEAHMPLTVPVSRDCATIACPLGWDLSL